MGTITKEQSDRLAHNSTIERYACECGLEDICDPTCFSHPDHPDNKDRTETKTGVPEVKLEPGWLARDILRAIARLKEWGLV